MNVHINSFYVIQEPEVEIVNPNIGIVKGNELHYPKSDLWP